MATENNQTITLSHSSPEVSAASRFAVTVNAVEINIAVGRQRQVFQPNGESAVGGVEYTHAFCVSPTAAKQLHDILGVALGNYEAKFGKIPNDPGAVEKLKGMAQSGGAKPKAPSKTAVKRAK